MFSRRRAIQVTVLLMLSLTLAVPVTAQEEEIVVTPEVKKIIDDYLSRRFPMALAVSRDGTNADFIYCSTGGCRASDPRHQHDALLYCGKDCVILAVGKEFKLPYRVDNIVRTVDDLPSCEPGALGADFPAGMRVVRLSDATCGGFRHYMAKKHFKAFATTEITGSSNWGWAVNYDSVDEAISNSLKQCNIVRERDSIPSECRLFALGDIIVYDLSEAELRAATDLYRKDKNATNADLPAN